MKIFQIITIILCAVLSIYFVACWIDVINNNTGNGSNFADWNYFEIMLGDYIHSKG